MKNIQVYTQKIIDFILKIIKKILPEKLYSVAEKFMTVQVVLYIFFGVLTTIVNIGSFAILSTGLHLNENLSNIIAIVLAVLFAYFTNKSLVFNSQATTFSEKFSEFIKFMIGRAFTMIVEFCGFYLLFNISHFPSLISKTVVTIVVIILNFFISKFFAFKK